MYNKRSSQLRPPVVPIERLQTQMPESRVQPEYEVVSSNSASAAENGVQLQEIAITALPGKENNVTSQKLETAAGLSNEEDSSIYSLEKEVRPLDITFRAEIKGKAVAPTQRHAVDFGTSIPSQEAIKHEQQNLETEKHEMLQKERDVLKRKDVEKLQTEQYQRDLLQSCAYQETEDQFPTEEQIRNELESPREVQDWCGLRQEQLDTISRYSQIVSFGLCSGDILEIGLDTDDEKLKSEIQQAFLPDEVKFFHDICAVAQHQSCCILRAGRTPDRTSGPDAYDSYGSTETPVHADSSFDEVGQATVCVTVVTTAEPKRSSESRDRVYPYVLTTMHVVSAEQYKDELKFLYNPILCEGPRNGLICCYRCKQESPLAVNSQRPETTKNASRGAFAQQLFVPGESIRPRGGRGVDALLVPVTKFRKDTLEKTGNGNLTPISLVDNVTVNEQVYIAFSQHAVISKGRVTKTRWSKIIDFAAKGRYLYGNLFEIHLEENYGPSPGESGSPVFVKRKNTLYLVGMHCASTPKNRCLALYVRNNVDEVIPSIHTKDFFIPSQLYEDVRISANLLQPMIVD